MTSKITLLDSLKLSWFQFARSRGWASHIKLSSGLEMSGADKTFRIQSPIFKFGDTYGGLPQRLPQTKAKSKVRNNAKESK